MPAISKNEARLKLQFVANTDHSIHAGLVAVEAMARRFALWHKVRKLTCLDPRKDQKRGYSPEVIVGQLLYALCSGGGCRSDSEALNDDPPARELPEVADARSLEEKLRYAAAQGAFLVLSVEPQWIGRTRQELARRFPVSVCDLDSVFLNALHAQPDQKRARWDAVLKADATPANSTDWRNLQRLVEAALPQVESSLRSREQTKLVVNPGLLARYDRMNLFAELAQDVGRSNGIHGLWMLVPANDQSPLPVLNCIPIPITNAAQQARLIEAWLSNRYRAAEKHITTGMADTN